MLSEKGQYKKALYWRSDGDIGHSWLCSPSREQVTTLHEQDTTKRTLKHGGEAEAPPCTTETRQTVLDG